MTFHGSGAPALCDASRDGEPVALQIAAEATQLRRPDVAHCDRPLIQFATTWSVAHETQELLRQPVRVGQLIAARTQLLQQLSFIVV